MLISNLKGKLIDFWYKIDILIHYDRYTPLMLMQDIRLDYGDNNSRRSTEEVKATEEVRATEKVKTPENG